VGWQRAPPAGQLRDSGGDGGVREPAGGVGPRETVSGRVAPPERIAEHLAARIPGNLVHNENSP
jgi:hypothetical protein